MSNIVSLSKNKVIWFDHTNRMEFVPYFMSWDLWSKEYAKGLYQDLGVAAHIQPSPVPEVSIDIGEEIDNLFVLEQSIVFIVTDEQGELIGEITVVPASQVNCIALIGSIYFTKPLQDENKEEIIVAVKNILKEIAPGYRMLQIDIPTVNASMKENFKLSGFLATEVTMRTEL